jgi:diaminohydroxyphosphoribosylaminopyrimidine deaminase/5-amino-6-(5-phosphoribosylamino)uracil reductase
MAIEAARQNAAFLHLSRRAARPYVALKLAASVDFRIADRSGRSRWVSGPEAREYVHWLRAGFDGIAVGLGTAVADDPRLSVRGAVPVRVPPARIVFDRRLELPSGLDLVRSADQSRTIVITRDQPPAERVESFEKLGLTILRARDLEDALRQLRTAGVTALLVEGGGRLAGDLLAAGLVDRFYWIQAPVWLGDGGVPAVRGLPSARLEDSNRWQVVERRALGYDTLLVLDRA